MLPHKLAPPISQIDAKTHVIVSIINGLGDAFLALPVIRCLIEWFGSDRVVVWAPFDALETVLSDATCVRLPLHLSRYSSSKLFVDEERDARRAVEALRFRMPLAWVSLNAYSPLWPVEVIAREKLRPQLVWGFGDAPQVFRSDSRGAITHMREQYFRVIGEIEPEGLAYRAPSIPLAANDQADSYLNHSLGTSATDFVAIHTDTESNKQWLPERWRALASLLFERRGIKVLALGKPSEALLADSLILPPPNGWHVQIAVLARACGFVGIDSVFAHVADALDIPGLALFGPTPVAEWGPKGPVMRAISAPRGDLQNVSAREVFDELEAAGLRTNRPLRRLL